MFWHEGQPDEKFMAGAEKTDVINKDIKFCGYFAIVTSEKMTAEKHWNYTKAGTHQKRLSVETSPISAQRVKGFIPMSLLIRRYLSGLLRRSSEAVFIDSYKSLL